MTMDSSTPPDESADTPDQVGQTGGISAEVVENAAVETAAATRDLTHAVADAAEDVNERSAQHATSVASETAEAFGTARDRLQILAAANPLGAQTLLASLKHSTESLGNDLETSYRTAAKGMAEFNSKAIAAWRVNAEAAVAHWQSLVSAKSLSDAIALNAEHTRLQMETMSAQTRDLTALASRIARGAVAPLKPLEG